MTHDDIIRMARETDLVPSWVQDIPDYQLKWIKDFAALVAAAEREAMKWDGIHTCSHECQRPACVALRNAVAAEREMCAKACEDLIGTRAMARHCADAIRARGNK